MTEPKSNVERLEREWRGGLGDAYVERNIDSANYARRGAFWQSIIDRTSPAKVLEVGCNVGGNLRWFIDRVPGGVHGVDINPRSIDVLRELVPEVQAAVGSARRLDFPDESFDLVFTVAVLIHVPDEGLAEAIDELVRTSSRWILIAEYFAPEPIVADYRGVPNSIFKRDYGAIMLEAHPELELVDRGLLTADDGLDEVHWWLIRRP